MRQAGRITALDRGMTPDDRRLVSVTELDCTTYVRPLVAVDQAACDIRAVNIDLDGDLDLLIAGQASKNVVWCENPRK